MKKPEFEFYQRPNGHIEFIEFLQSLPDKDRSKLVATIANVQDQGLIVARKMKWIKKLDDNLFELRSKTGNNIQRGLYFHVTDTNYQVTHGFSKKAQKTPPYEIKHAMKIRDEYWEEHKND
ncbi:type II toxin-antitoxin system RelE/ParE family toxin [Lactiplantibacillus mudanjiangensis]|uniref:Type II toxin-antitoxin system RelE/ParE family toxin [Lactobacillus murinus] n=1 Tax=Lactiplantibacillus mudanjiangensis TaxID=1296538 RepID=A0A660E7J3_9LACO|nr:type II toxin-antitoxin system RelE/ParE family toxin [Lactiplantibacillus mudanjiangensis]VDG21033.1 type II toxin-antitoxin system RelE/ParE family toxin [Lactobacillus murinus] [Lactiplantibacillus mudanjiangensis]VDG26054.1 type II toxin-antitoxin system RelE/ParE family toxin [Lactobacillus murinus] [Lactiplantibacillus mudanjiangensis]VDG29108.1 type II toxin-antitoxin system RelE/ParE family toxin [Lactobacillus murinus] [Lactiplantibacillus mudanjiangensis]VDG31628.1 type II toxin-an